jgi:peptide subunit release factor 1 (eRF1)
MSERERKGVRYLYECDECHTRRYVSWVEANRAAKPRCRACGCTRLEIVSEDARKDRARLNQERLTGTGGSLKLASQCENRHRAVR